MAAPVRPQRDPLDSLLVAAIVAGLLALFYMALATPLLDALTARR